MTKLKIAAQHLGALSLVDPVRVAVEAAAGGMGLDWSQVPAGVSGAGALAWGHLADTFRDEPVRFREADRGAVAAYCSAVEMAAESSAALREHGVLVAGRSEADAGRPVRSPAWAMWRDASTQLRQWSSELGLSPSSRSRMKIPADGGAVGDNPFAP